MPLLGRAARDRDKEVGETLIQAGAAIQLSDPLPCSPVYIAITSNDVHMLEFLIRRGADVSTFRPEDWRDLRADQI